MSAPDVQVRLLCPDDLEAVAALEAACFAEPWSAQSLRLLCAEGGFGVVVTEGEHLLAYGGMTVVLDEGSITNIATHPEHRRQGYGRRVVGALLDEAKRRGVCSVVLEVRESNDPARRLYESLGFCACGVRKNFYRYPSENAVLMSWTDA